MAADTIGARIRYWRLRRGGMNQAVLAGLAGVSQPYISQVESGRKTIERRSTLVAIAGALQVTVADLLGQPGDPTDPGRARAAASVPAIREAVIMRKAGVVRQTNRHATATVDRAVELDGEGDFAARGAILPPLLSACRGPDLIRTAYAAVWHLHFTGYIDLAREVAGLAMDEARDVDSPEWVGFAEYLRASSLPPETAGLASDLAKRAAAVAQPHAGDPHVRQVYGMLHLTAALRAATSRRATDAMEHLDEAAREATTLGDPGDGRGFCHLAFGPTNVDVWRLGILTELGDHEQAAALGPRINPERVGVPNRQAAYWMDYGQALTTQGHDDEAVAAYLRAEAVCPQWYRLRPSVRDTLAVLVRRAKRRAVSRPLQRAALAVGLRVGD